jgi:hypothetical protein
MSKKILPPEKHTKKVRIDEMKNAELFFQPNRVTIFHPVCSKVA